MDYYEMSPKYHGWGWGYGFFSNYRICLEMLIDFHNKKKFMTQNPYISWKKTTWVENFNPFEDKECNSEINPFDWWFDQKIPKSNDRIISGPKEPQSGSIIDHAKHYFDDKENLEMQQTIEKLYIKPKKYILDEIERIYDKEFKNEVVLGVMARGSEYNVLHPFYGVYGIDHYINEIKKVLEENKEITKIFVVSEETEFINRICDAFPNVFYLPNVFRRTDEDEEYITKYHCWINISKKRKNHTIQLGKECIVQTKLLGKCDYLCGRFCGLTAGAVLWNENIKKLKIIT